MDRGSSTMRAARVHRFGGPEVIAIEDVRVPEPGPGEVLVRVGAAGVGPWDGWIRAGRSVLPQPLPLTLGSDLAGTIVKVGAGVEGFAAGEPVLGVTNKRFTDAYAEFALAQAAMIARRPDTLVDVAAASVPVIAVTAWQALFDQAHLTAGQTVLIHGAAGSVGSFAVQLAREAGLQIIATASGRDADYVGQLGATTVVDHRAERFEHVARNVDTVIDLVGGETQARSFAVLKPGGHLISAVSEPDAAEAARRGVQARFFLVDVTTAALSAIADRLADGRLKVDVGIALPLDEARTAHEMLEGRRPKPRGKIVLAVQGATP